MVETREKKDGRREILNDEESDEKRERERERWEWDRDMEREEERTRDNGCNEIERETTERRGRKEVQRGERGAKMVAEGKG